ncbi:MAG: glycosyltransferase family 1 protein [Cytophagales bacterium]|nr:MAG: glycosyltransferase family 1 protein [Cytophagales bacterium]
MQNKLKVLMLGWEFPPFLTGGLGQACYGIAKAMSNLVDLTVIIPRSEPAFVLENVNIIGLSSLTEEDIQTERLKYSLKEITEVIFVATDLSPYPIPVMKTVVHLEDIQETVAETISTKEVKELYNSGSNYGENIMQKVDTFTDLVVQIAEKRDFDIIYAHDWLTFPAAIQLKRITGKPLAVHVHSLETDRIGMWARSPQNKVYHIEYDGMTMADLIIPVSFFTKAQILEHYPFIPADKIFPIHNAIDPLPERENTPNQVLKKEPEKLKEYGYTLKPDSPEKKMVLFLGRITYQKGPEFLLETAEKLLKKDKEIVFVIAGAGDQQNWLMTEVTKKKLGENFIFTGFLSKARVHELLERVDVYFMPSVSEPFGLSALEAAQHEIPAVLSKQSGVSEILHSVLVADCWDANKFANYLYALLHYEGIRELLAEASKREVDRLTWDNTAAQIVSLFEKQVATQSD